MPGDVRCSDAEDLDRVIDDLAVALLLAVLKKHNMIAEVFDEGAVVQLLLDSALDGPQGLQYYAMRRAEEDKGTEVGIQDGGDPLHDLGKREIERRKSQEAG